MKNIYVCLLLGMVLAGCGSDEEETPPTITEPETTTCAKSDAVPSASPKIDLSITMSGFDSSCSVFDHSSGELLAVGQGGFTFCNATYKINGAATGQWEFAMGNSVSAEYSSWDSEFDGVSVLLTCD